MHAARPRLILAISLALLLPLPTGAATVPLPEDETIVRWMVWMDGQECRNFQWEPTFLRDAGVALEREATGSGQRLRFELVSELFAPECPSLAFDFQLDAWTDAGWASVYAFAPCGLFGWGEVMADHIPYDVTSLSLEMFVPDGCDGLPAGYYYTQLEIRSADSDFYGSCTPAGPDLCVGATSDAPYDCRDGSRASYLMVTPLLTAARHCQGAHVYLASPAASAGVDASDYYGCRAYLIANSQFTYLPMSCDLPVFPVFRDIDWDVLP